MVVKDKGDKEDSDYEDAASQENARDPVLEVMLTVAGPNYSAWTRTDITGADPKTIMKPLTLIGGEKWLEQLSTDKNISSDMLTHLQKIQSFVAAYNVSRKELIYHMPDLLTFLTDVVDVRNVEESDLNIGAFVHAEDADTFHVPVPPTKYKNFPLGGIFNKVKRIGMLRRFCQWMKEHHTYSSVGQHSSAGTHQLQPSLSSTFGVQNPAKDRREKLDSLGRQLITDYQIHLGYQVPPVPAVAVGEMYQALVQNAPIPLHALSFYRNGGDYSLLKEATGRAKSSRPCLDVSGGKVEVSFEEAELPMEDAWMKEWPTLMKNYQRCLKIAMHGAKFQRAEEVLESISTHIGRMEGYNFSFSRFVKPLVCMEYSVRKSVKLCQDARKTLQDSWVFTLTKNWEHLWREQKAHIDKAHYNPPAFPSSQKRSAQDLSYGVPAGWQKRQKQNGQQEGSSVDARKTKESNPNHMKDGFPFVSYKGHCLDFQFSEKGCSEGEKCKRTHQEKCLFPGCDSSHRLCEGHKDFCAYMRTKNPRLPQ